MRVLFPTDFSVYAKAVFACLPELKAAGMRQVVLLGVAQEESVDLIVMGAQGETAAQVLLLGSVANQVVHRATVPMLTQKF